MGSVRFPGKMMADFQGAPIIEWVLRRLQRAAKLDAIVLATSERDENQVLVDAAERIGVSAFQGSEDDVLGRFVEAAKLAGAETVVRVCADNPLIAPEAVDVLVEGFQRSGADYAFNHVPRMDNGWPDGLGAEVLSFGTLDAIAARATAPAQREHVTAYIWDHAEEYDILAVPCPQAWLAPDASVRLDVDRPEDLARMNAAFAGAGIDWSVGDLLAAWRAQ